MPYRHGDDRLVGQARLVRMSDRESGFCGLTEIAAYMSLYIGRNKAAAV